ncbi:phage portal protein [Leuconostoc mesenteroides]|uniref:phage portal protein n=1 Tax=Leuconostoc mesenteroides TaxID=1245 RepID=UPI001FBA0EDA|nr:phage portal protein [Leuconostoc mesenteroides]MCJ2160499.1 phage portal protein [Leuconostoc mesenteroides]MCM6836549.1 phage portal protein [Leuconostoc mesenteroides]
MFFEKRSQPIRGSGSSYNLSSGQMVLGGGFISADRALKNSDVWTAVNIISSDIARVKFHAPKKQKIDKLLGTPSRVTNRFNFFQSMIAQMLLTGNAYALRRLDSSGEYLEFVSPSHISQYLSDDGQTTTYDITFNGTQEDDLKNVPADDVIHLRLLSTDGGLTGKSPLTALVDELTLQSGNNKLANSVFNKSANPSAMLKLNTGNKLNSEGREAIRSAFEEANTGANAGRVMVMDGTFDYSQLEVKSDVAKLLTATDWTRAQIAKAFMLPSDMLGSESEHSNADQIRATYNNTIGRYLAPALEELSMKYGENIIADIREATDLDGAMLEQRTTNLIKGGAISPVLGLEILKDSHSDLVTPDLIEAVGQENAVGKESTNAGNQNV